jgi:hypothetical protein
LSLVPDPTNQDERRKTKDERPSRRELEQEARVAAVRDEHAHDVLVGRVALQTDAAQHVDEAVRIALHAQLEYAPAVPFERLDGPLGGDAALVHHDDVVAGVLDVGQQVRREDQIQSLVVRDVAYELEHLVASLGIHPVGRLVEEEQVRIVDERLRELDALFHAGRVGLDVAVSRFAEADVVEHFMRALHRVGARQPCQLAAVRHEGDRRHARNVPVGFRHIADAAADLERRGLHIVAEHAHVAAVGRDEAEQRLQHRALARAIGTEQADGARLEHGADVAQRPIAAVFHADAIELNDGGRGRRQVRGRRHGSHAFVHAFRYTSMRGGRFIPCRGGRARRRARA